MAHKTGGILDRLKSVVARGEEETIVIENPWEWPHNDYYDIHGDENVEYDFSQVEPPEDDEFDFHLKQASRFRVDGRTQVTIVFESEDSSFAIGRRSLWDGDEVIWAIDRGYEWDDEQEGVIDAQIVQMESQMDLASLALHDSGMSTTEIETIGDLIEEWNKEE